MSGRAMALANIDFSDASTLARSVPELMAENAVRTRIPPERSSGSGTSKVLTSPVRISFKTACMVEISAKIKSALSYRAIVLGRIGSRRAQHTLDLRYFWYSPPCEDACYECSNFASPHVPGTSAYHRLAQLLVLRSIVLQCILYGGDEFIRSSIEPQPRSCLIFIERSDYHRLACSQILTHLDRAAIANELAVESPREHKYIDLPD